MKTSLNPTQHERAEWLRFAADLDKHGHLLAASAYRNAASRPHPMDFGVMEYDALMAKYRTWLVFGMGAL